jgi:hypothetical protein
MMMHTIMKVTRRYARRRRRRRARAKPARGKRSSVQRRQLPSDATERQLR